MDKSNFLQTGTLEAGNDFYRIFVQDIPGQGVGLYTAKTGPLHPAGPNLNVLYGGESGSPGTTFNTIRSFSSQTDYVQTTFPPSSEFNVVSLDPFGHVTPIGTTGIRTTYVLQGAPDSMQIISEIEVKGDTFESSFIQVTTRISNTGTASLGIGTRYEWDFQIGLDDGPTFQPINPNGDVYVTEAEFDRPNFTAYKIVDNDENPHPPTFFVFGSVNEPDLPTPVVNLRYVSWPGAFDTAFFYTVTPSLDIADESAGINDSAVLLYFGHSPIDIAPGETATLGARIFLTPPTEADLAVVSWDSKDPVELGENIRYINMVTNYGPDLATGVVLKDILPPNLKFISATSSQGTCTVNNNTVICQLGDLNKNSSAIVEITVKPEVEGIVLNTVTVEGSVFDPNLSNNSFTQTTLVKKNHSDHNEHHDHHDHHHHPEHHDHHHHHDHHDNLHP